jgi:hypothetical protein
LFAAIGEVNLHGPWRRILLALLLGDFLLCRRWGRSRRQHKERADQKAEEETRETWGPDTDHRRPSARDPMRLISGSIVSQAVLVTTPFLIGTYCRMSRFQRPRVRRAKQGRAGTPGNQAARPCLALRTRGFFP